MNNKDFKELLKEIDNSYISNYIPEGEELIFKNFINDLYFYDLDREITKKGKKENCFIWVLVKSWVDDKFNYTYTYSLDKVNPVRPSTTPLYYILYRLAQNKELDISISPNIFFKPNFCSMNDEELVKATNVFFIDIDNIDVSKMSQKEIEKFLYNNYSFITDKNKVQMILKEKKEHKMKLNEFESEHYNFLGIQDKLIDNIELTEKEKYFLKLYYKSTCDTDKELNKYTTVYPNYIVKSGKGLHLYFLLEMTENVYKGKKETALQRSKYKKIKDTLALLFDADNLSLNHYLRLPTSWNCKEKYATGRKTELFSTKIEQCIDIEELYNLMFFNRIIKLTEMEQYKYEIGQYTLNKKDILYNLVKKANRKSAKNFEDYFTIISDNANIFKCDESPNPQVTIKNSNSLNTKVKKIKAKEAEIKKSENINTNKNDIFVNSGKEGAYLLGTNRIRDLTKWFYLHIGDMEGKREKFFFIYCNILFYRGLDKDIIKRKCTKLNDDLEEPLKEFEIDNIINHNKKYKFSNSKIAKILEFTEEEKDTFICSYTEKQKKEKLNKKWNRENSKRADTKNKEKAEKWNDIINIINSNKDKNNTELANILNVSVSTVKRYKNKLKDIA